MKTHKIIMMSLMAVSLSACQTLKGIQKDVTQMGSTVSSKVSSLTKGNEGDDADTGEAAQKTAKNIPASLIMDGACPPIVIDPQLSTMSEFYDPSNPSPETEVSHIALQETKSSCQIDGEYLEVKIEIAFEGGLGPKAKRKTNDRPFFAYPYFVSVTDNMESELAKELFAASVTYESNQEKVELVETIRQRLPLNDDGSSPDYRINIGFQLTEEQLFYNASH